MLHLTTIRHLLVALTFLFFTNSLAADDSQSLFQRHIAPILADKCVQCHGPDETQRKSDLRLDVDTRVDQKKGTLGLAILDRIESTDPDVRMPPPALGKSLSESERAHLRAWIEAGAKFETHWAYQPIGNPICSGEVLPSIDSLVDEALSAKGLERSPPITRSQWIRRVYVDLVGILPTWQEVQAFEEDTSPLAHEAVVDRLLSSTLYGQRWGKYWLDLARYADTHGGAAIGFTSFPFSYTYRDYVIDAFNKDLPYDQFVVEQIAADQLSAEPNDPRLAALGFLTVGMRYRNEHDIVDDQIDVVTRGLMGLTVACARCHDHKFDAIPTRDYYALYATLSPSESPTELPIIGPAKSDEEANKKTEAYFQKLEVLKTQYDEMARDQIEVMKHRLRMQVGMYLREIAKGTPEQDVATSFLSYRTDDIRPVVFNRWRSYLSNLPNDDPVFGLWHQLAALPADGFAEAAESMLEARTKEIPDPSKSKEYHALGATSPKWNPLVLEALHAKKPSSMLDVADTFGELFAKLHQAWLGSLLETSLEAVSSKTVVPDEDAKHQNVNSPVYRQLRRHLYGSGTPTELPVEVASQLLNRTISDSLGGKRGAIHNHHLQDPGSVPRAMALVEAEREQDSFVFVRGNHMTLGERVKPGFLTALSKGTNDLKYQPGNRRLALAKAITDKENPLTRRVIVNWVWQQHFGQGIVKSTDDFGTRGTPPSIPRLLDYLANVFLEDGWSIKQLHRRILLSKTYGQASIENDAARIIDPENAFVWRMPRRRLDLEAMRDSMLSVAGELDSSLGGRPIDLATSPTIPRRSVYGFINRDIVSNLASTFDAANPNACSLKRPDTLVPQQTLFALNSDFIQDRAARLEVLMNSSTKSDPEERIVWLYRRIYSRTPSSVEMELARSFVDKVTAESHNPKASRWQILAHAMLASNEFSFVD
ncbi:MAG: PSD1 and planctomycete cytochrome C domain-containing protein [Pirellula sp.]